jgi:hypothetical protein
VVLAILSGNILFAHKLASNAVDSTFFNSSLRVGNGKTGYEGYKNGSEGEDGELHVEKRFG